ncbi:MAG: hypothetical protein Q9208_001450 [Pyrenodesmia sp. 3 TL-2023]
MQLTTTTLLHLLALSALPSTLAFPTAPSSTNQTLHPRGGRDKWSGGHPKIGSFLDPTCALKSLIPPPPKTKFAAGWGCIKFTPETDNVGIEWGNTRARALNFFTDDKCEDYATEMLVSPVYEGLDNGRGKADRCISYKAHGGNWRSVKFWAPPY